LFDPAGAALSFLTLLLAYAVDPIEARKEYVSSKVKATLIFLSQLAKRRMVGRCTLTIRWHRMGASSSSNFLFKIIQPALI